MIQSLCRVLLIALALGASNLGVPRLAVADDAPSALPATDQQAIRQVIEAQLDAFRHDDGARAFGFATPAIQQKFGDAARFMQMVRSGYTAVYRPRSVTFDRLLDTTYGPDQIVKVIGPDGRAYTAHYIMQKQPDGRWMINGCYLTRVEDQSV